VSEKRAINPSDLAAPKGFAHGWLVESGDARTLYLAGQCAHDRDGALCHQGDLVGQLRLALRNIESVLRDAEMVFGDLVQLNLYVRSRDDYTAARRGFGAVWREIGGKHYPAMAMFEVSSLFDPDALIEIQGIAAS